MNHRNGNSRPADVPPWAWVLIQEIRQFSREAAEDRKQAAEDRKQAERDRAEIRNYVAGIHNTLGELTRIQATLADAVVVQTHLLHQVIKRQDHQTKLLEDILRTLRVQGNGRSGNGRRR